MDGGWFWSSDSCFPFLAFSPQQILEPSTISHLPTPNKLGDSRLSTIVSVLKNQNFRKALSDLWQKNKCTVNILLVTWSSKFKSISVQWIKKIYEFSRTVPFLTFYFITWPSWAFQHHLGILAGCELARCLQRWVRISTSCRLEAQGSGRCPCARHIEARGWGWGRLGVRGWHWPVSQRKPATWVIWRNKTCDHKALTCPC